MAQVKFLKAINDSAGWKEMEATDDLTINSFSGDGSNITNLDMSSASSGVLDKAFYDPSMAGSGILFTNGVISSKIKNFEGIGLGAEGIYTDYDDSTIGMVGGKLAVIGDFATNCFYSINFTAASDVVATSPADTLNFEAGVGITFETDPLTNTITFISNGAGSVVLAPGLTEINGEVSIDYNYLHVWRNTQEIGGFDGNKLTLVGSFGDASGSIFSIGDFNDIETFTLNQYGDISSNLIVCKGISVLGNTSLGASSSSTINLVGVLNSNVIPDASNSRNLGDSSHRWEDLYVDEIVDSGNNIVSTSRFQMIPNTGTSKPAASITVRGQIYTTLGAGGVADTVEICLKSAGDTYSWVSLAIG